MLVDLKCSCIWLEPDVLVDAILAKRNVGTTIGMAPIVIGIGPDSRRATTATPWSVEPCAVTRSVACITRVQHFQTPQCLGL